MKNILCFGDSNTYGESPEGFGRYERHERWPGILQRMLGNGFYVVEEGLNGRTTVWDDPVEIDKSGYRHLPVCLNSHAPLDLVILMLGTNDLKRRFSVTPSDIAASAEQLVGLILRQENGRRGTPPRVLLAAPTCVLPGCLLGEMLEGRHEDSLRLGPLYREAAERLGVDFINAAEVAWPSQADGLHFDREGHEKMARAMYQKVLSILGPAEGEGG